MCIRDSLPYVCNGQCIIHVQQVSDHSRVVRHNKVTAHSRVDSDAGPSESKKSRNVAHPVRLNAVALHVQEIDIRTILLQRQFIQLRYTS